MEGRRRTSGRQSHQGIIGMFYTVPGLGGGETQHGQGRQLGPIDHPLKCLCIADSTLQVSHIELLISGSNNESICQI